MNVPEYIKLLDESVFLGSGQLAEIQKILNKLQKDKKLADDEKLEVERYANDIQAAPPSPNIQTTGISSSADDRPVRWLPKYDMGGGELFPSGMEEMGFNEHCDNIAPAYAEWLMSEYLPCFHPMPYSEKQYPILVSIALLNCNATISKKQNIPIGYFLGSNGSGKTEVGKMIMAHYPTDYTVEILPNTTGAGIRDALDDKFGRGEAGFALFDNFNPAVFMVRAGNFYDVILSNNKESSLFRVSSRGDDTGKSEYRTHCFKLLTSIFDLTLQSAPEFGEIERRTVTLRFQEDKPKDSRLSYDWECMARVYQRIWGEESLNIIQGEYAHNLRKLARMKPHLLPISGKKWNICQVPIAVGVMCGIWSSIGDGIEAFARHFEWLKESKSGVGGSMLATILTKFIKEELPKKSAEGASNRFLPPSKKLNPNQLTQQQLTEHLEKTSGFQVGKRDIDAIIPIMGNLGYQYERVGDGMGFIKPEPLAK